MSSPRCSSRAPAVAPEHIAETKKIAQDIAEICEGGFVKPLRSTAVYRLVPIAVVGSALLGIAQDGYSFRSLLEFLFRFGIARIAVGMVLEGELAIGAFSVWSSQSRLNASTS